MEYHARAGYEFVSAHTLSLEHSVFLHSRKTTKWEKDFLLSYPFVPAEFWTMCKYTTIFLKNTFLKKTHFIFIPVIPVNR